MPSATRWASARVWPSPDNHDRKKGRLSVLFCCQGQAEKESLPLQVVRAIIFPIAPAVGLTRVTHSRRHAGDGHHQCLLNAGIRLCARRFLLTRTV